MIRSHLLVLSLVLIGCTAQKREPSSLTGRTFDKVSIQSEVDQILLQANRAQQLSLLYDLRLKTFSAKNLRSSYSSKTQLDCNLQDSFVAMHEIEHRLSDLQEAALESDPSRYEWLINRFEPNAQDDSIQVLAKAQMMRALFDNHQELCTGRVCPSFPKTLVGSRLDIFDDVALYRFKTRSLKQISHTPQIEVQDTDTGDCFASEAEDQTLAPFDWKKQSTDNGGLKDKEFAITYDDGPSTSYTPLLEKMWLDSGLAKPTFFWLNENIKSRLPIALRIHGEGFMIGSHSYDHPDIGNLAQATAFDSSAPGAISLNHNNKTHFAAEKSAATRDFASWKKAVLEDQIWYATLSTYKLLSLPLTNGNEHLFRLPYGSGVRNPLIGHYFSRLNARSYVWSIDSLDWLDHNPVSVFNRIKEGMEIQEGGIVLMHDIQPRTPEVTRELIAWLKSQNQIQIVELPTQW